MGKKNNFGWKIVERHHAENKLLGSLQLICMDMDAQWNIYGLTTAFAWTHNRISMDAQRNLDGRTTKFVWTNNGMCLDT